MWKLFGIIVKVSYNFSMESRLPASCPPTIHSTHRSGAYNNIVRKTYVGLNKLITILTAVEVEL